MTRNSLFRVAIVGRPNVGKSTLLNRMRGSRVAIVEPTAGVTRDRIAVPVRIRAEGRRRLVEVIDTGGIGIVDRDDLGPHVEEQVRLAVATSRIVLFVVDAREGVTPLDVEVARRLRSSDASVLLVCNKTENAATKWQAEEFRSLGVAEGPFQISAQNGVGLVPLYERILDLLPPQVEAEVETEATPAMKFAVVGRRNVGKSTLINRLAGEERMIVSEIPGTTRDAVDVVFERDGRSFVAIDTAGLRRRRSLTDAVEFYSEARSRRTVRRADVVLLLYDAASPLAAVDKRLARYVIDHHKPLILAGNRWDLVSGVMQADRVKELRWEVPGVSFAPTHFLSARTGRGVDALIELGLAVGEEAAQRVDTSELNRVLHKTLESRSPSSKGQRAKILYGTQAGVSPPTFVLFVNDKRLISKDHLRFLENRIRAELGFKRVPVHIVLRDRSGARSGGGRSAKES